MWRLIWRRLRIRGSRGKCAGVWTPLRSDVGGGLREDFSLFSRSRASDNIVLALISGLPSGIFEAGVDTGGTRNPRLRSCKERLDMSASAPLSRLIFSLVATPILL